MSAGSRPPPLVIVALGKLHRIAHIPQAAFLSAAISLSTRDLSIVNVQTGDDAFVNIVPYCYTNRDASTLILSKICKLR